MELHSIALFAIVLSACVWGLNYAFHTIGKLKRRLRARDELIQKLILGAYLLSNKTPTLLTARVEYDGKEIQVWWIKSGDETLLLTYIQTLREKLGLTIRTMHMEQYYPYLDGMARAWRKPS